MFKRDRTHLYRFDVMLSTNNFKCVLSLFIRNHLILIHSLIQKHKRKSGEFLRFPVCYWVTRSTYKPRELSSKCHSIYFIVCVYRVMLITSVISRVAPRFINPLSNPNIPIKNIKRCGDDGNRTRVQQTNKVAELRQLNVYNIPNVIMAIECYSI